MKKLLITAVLGLMLVTGNAFAKGGSGGSVSVRGYVTKNGTYVAPHMRSAPDGNVYNNWSTKGNINPYTGKEGTKNPYPGLPTGPGLGISVTPPVGIVIPNVLGENPIIITHPVNKPAYLASIGDSFQFAYTSQEDMRQRVLSYLYGNYVLEVQGSLWDIQSTFSKHYNIPTDIFKIVSDDSDGSPYIVKVVFHSFFKEYGHDKLLVITKASKLNHDCHACGVLLGFSVFRFTSTSSRNNIYTLEYFHPYAGFNGQWGKASPSITLMKYKEMENYAVRFRDCSMHQGYADCYEKMVDIMSSDLSGHHEKSYEGPDPNLGTDSPEWVKWIAFQKQFLAGQ